MRKVTYSIRACENEKYDKFGEKFEASEYSWQISFQRRQHQEILLSVLIKSDFKLENFE